MSFILFGVIGFVVLTIIVFALNSGGRKEGSLEGSARGSPSQVPPQVWKVTAVQSETPSTISFEVDASVPFKAGQFVLVRPQPSHPWRSYSFSRAPGQPLRLTVKRVEGGQVSTYLTQTLKVGDALEVKGPYGQFVLPATMKRGLFIAGGSGITPFLSMLQEQAAKGWPAPITLIDANRTAVEQIFKAELDALAQSSNGQLELVYLLDNAPSGPLQGPPTQEVLGRVLEGRPAPDVVAMCGPGPMMDGARALSSARYPGVTILEEKFTTASESVGTGPSHEVEVVWGEKSKTFAVKEGEQVLVAARTAGVGLTAGCEMGACGVCRVRVLEGHIEVPEDACLSDRERDEGYALVCVGKIKGPCRIEPA